MPTPIDEYKRPDLTPLERASETVGKVLKKGDVVVYESTVYPGLHRGGLRADPRARLGPEVQQGFLRRLQPERINPGDKEHRLPTIQQGHVGLDARGRRVRRRAVPHRSSRPARTRRRASSVAEAAKVIENTQRDVNIALINELALIFNRLGIDTEEVLEAAGTKWNFLPFRPGLVGGHCIGVDPYYLTHKAQEIGYHPEMILAGRRINDSMAQLRRRRRS